MKISSIYLPYNSLSFSFIKSNGKNHPKRFGSNDISARIITEQKIGRFPSTPPLFLHTSSRHHPFQPPFPPPAAPHQRQHLHLRRCRIDGSRRPRHTVLHPHPVRRRDTCLSTSDLLPTHPQTPSLIPRHGHHTHRGPSPLKSIPRLDQRHRRRTHSSLSTPATNTPICACVIHWIGIGSKIFEEACTTGFIGVN